MLRMVDATGALDHRSGLAKHANRFRLLAPLLSAAALLSAAPSIAAEPLLATLPTGQRITPAAAPGALFQRLEPELPALPGGAAGQASALTLSPDGRTLLVLTSGFNRNSGADGKEVSALSNEYVFVYDVTGAHPVKRQVLQIPNSFLGLAWAPDGSGFYVSGGVDDDVIAFTGAPGGYLQTRVYPLHHTAGLGIGVKPEVGGVAVSPDGRRLLAADVENDAVSLLDLDTGAVTDLDLRPGGGRPGGTFPTPVVWTSNRTAYVGAERDREVIRIDLDGAAPRVGARISTTGQPSAFARDPTGRRLYVTLANSDAVALIDTAGDRIVAQAATAGPPGREPQGLGGAGSNALSLSRDGQRLYVSDGGENALAVLPLGPDGAPRPVAGLIPTGWYPTGVQVSADGRTLYAVNGKSDPGPNPGGCRNTLSIARGAETPCRAANQYVWQLEKAGFLTTPVPDRAALARLTDLVERNNRSAGASTREQAMAAFLHARIHHVIYVVKENRSYDQVLGDLGRGDGDGRLELFPESIAPNHHRLARQFVDLDAFRDSGESSNTGWNWTTAARTNDWTEREAPVNYAGRGLQYDQEGDNRNVNVGMSTAAERHAASAKSPDDPNLLGGQADVAALDGPDDDEGHGYIWDAARRAGLSMRNWGFYGDLSRYDKGEPDRIPLDREPWLSQRRVFYPTKAVLAPISDPYFRGFDQAFPDFWRMKEWLREFGGFQRSGNAPTLMMVRLPHDHFGDFAEGIDGVNTVETEMADNDYAIGTLVQAVAQSRFAKDTLIFMVEDDAQNGADHVDAHRSVLLVAGPYVREGAVVSTPYTTVDLVRTIEGVLGLKPLNLHDARARFMADLFDTSAGAWSYQAVIPAALRTTQLPLPSPATAEAPPGSMRSSSYWAHAMAGQDFRREDRLDTPRFNAALWQGLKPDVR